MMEIKVKVNKGIIDMLERFARKGFMSLNKTLKTLLTDNSRQRIEDWSTK